MKKSLIILTLLASVLAFAGCSNSNTDAASIEYESYTRDTMGIQFEKPKEWYEPIESADKEDFYIFVVPNQFSAEDKVEGRFQITKITDLSEDTILESAYKTYKDAKLQALEGQVQNLSTIEDAKEATLFEAPAKEVIVQYDSTWGEDTRTVTEVGAVVLYNGSIYVVEYFDEKVDYDKYRPVLDKLYSTIKEI